MHMLYNSDSFTVVAFEIPAPAGVDAAAGSLAEAPPATRGGFEIVDKFAQKDIFIEGAMAESFKAGVEALMAGKPSEEDIDDYIGRYTSLMPQPLVLH
ncbi:MAG: DUF3567 domain-containing protein [Caldimonas sp.]